MTNSHDALYRAICVHPDEDTPRLAFADLIEENGDALRAHFIRTQIALARLPQYDAAWVKARQFEPDAATGWCMTSALPKVPAGASWHRFEFRRGFPWKVGVLSLGELIQGDEAIFEAAPIQALNIETRDRPNLAALADWPHLARLHKLELSSGWLGASDIAQFVETEYATNLTELGFEFDGLTPDGLATLAASELFSRLEGLELRSISSPAALLVDSLGAASEPGALSWLSLPQNRLRHTDVEHLCTLPIVQELQHLELNNNKLGSEGVTALAESRIAGSLHTLNLSKTLLGVSGVKALVEAASLARLRMLDLSENELGPVAVKALAGCRSLRGLRVLNLTNNLVGDAGAVGLASSRSLAGLLELNLCNAKIGDSGALALAESPYLENLVRLDLRTRDDQPLSSKARDALMKRFGDRVCL